MRFTEKHYDTDVLVLGSSAAGCGAAIAARRKGAEVLLVDKGRLESSGCLGGGNDHFMAVLDETENDGYDDLLTYYATPTSGVSPKMVRRFYEAMRPCIEALDEAGVEFFRTEDGHFLRSVGFGQPGPWWIHINHGYTVKPRLAKYIQHMGVKVVNHFQVTRLITDGDRIAGCLGFNVLTGDRITVRCKTAVLAMGLTAQRVSNNSTHKPYNMWFSPYVTGSQVVLPLQIGARVLNLDIADMATMLPKGWGAPGMNGINNMGGHELNAKGERFMFKYDPMGENGLRRNQVMGTYQEQVEGSGPPFYMDMTHFDPEEARHLQYDLMPGDKETYLDYCRARNIDFTKKPLEVEIGERLIGGIVMCDDNQETDIKNLFNANIIHSFSGATCLGYQAGNSAAERAATTALPSLHDETVQKYTEELFAPMHNACASPVNYSTFEDGIRQVMDYYVGYRRTEAGMRRALESFTVLDEFRSRVRAESLRDLMRVHEGFELFRLCRTYIEACLQRKESGRAMYARTDYPDLSPEFNCSLITRFDAQGNPAFSWTHKA